MGMGSVGAARIDWKWRFGFRVPVPGDEVMGDKRRIAGRVIADCGGVVGKPPRGKRI